MGVLIQNGMEEEMNFHLPHAQFGELVADYVAPRGMDLPSRPEFEATLGAVFEEMRQHDQATNDIVVEHINACDDWSVRTRQGRSNNHYLIDTYITGRDGDITYIEIDHAFTRQPDESDWTYANPQDESIRQLMQDGLPRLCPGEEISQQDVTDFVVSRAKYARIRHFTPEAIARLREHAVDDADIIEILRLEYRLKPVIEMTLCGNGAIIPIEDPDPNWMHGLLNDHIINSVVILKGEVEGESVAEHITSAQSKAANEIVEDATHGNEYLELYNQIRHNTKLSDSERTKISARMREIMDVSGHPEAHIEEWWYVMPAQIDGLREIRENGYDVWDEHVLDALRRHLADLGLYLYEREISARAATAQAVWNAQLGAAIDVKQLYNTGQ